MAPKDKTREAEARAGMFTLEKGVLRANGDMYWEYLEEFDHNCKLLLESRKAQVEIDLTRVYFISSNFLGCLSNLVIRASRLKKRVLLKVSPDISWLFEIMGMQKNVDLEVW